MSTRPLRSRRQRAFAIILLTMASLFIWSLIALVLLRSVQPASQFPL